MSTRKEDVAAALLEAEAKLAEAKRINEETVAEDRRLAEAVTADSRRVAEAATAHDLKDLAAGVAEALVVSDNAEMAEARKLTKDISNIADRLGLLLDQLERNFISEPPAPVIPHE